MIPKSIFKGNPWFPLDPSFWKAFQETNINNCMKKEAEANFF